MLQYSLTTSALLFPLYYLTSMYISDHWVISSCTVKVQTIHEMHFPYWCRNCKIVLCLGFEIVSNAQETFLPKNVDLDNINLSNVFWICFSRVPAIPFSRTWSNTRPSGGLFVPKRSFEDDTRRTQAFWNKYAFIIVIKPWVLIRILFRKPQICEIFTYLGACTQGSGVQKEEWPAFENSVSQSIHVTYVTFAFCGTFASIHCIRYLHFLCHSHCYCC